MGLASLGAAGVRGGYSVAQQGNRALRRIGRTVKRTRSSGTQTIVRTVPPNGFSLVAGEAALSLAPVLSWVQTTDLTGMYDQYKLDSIRIRLIPRFDPAQSGVTNNTCVWVAMASDPTGQVTAPTFSQTVAFQNAKVGPLVAGKEFVYTFRPRPINALAAGSFAVNETDWLILSAGGINVAHNNLLINVKSMNTSAVTSYDYILEYHIRVRGLN